MERCSYPDTVYSLLEEKYYQQIYDAFSIFSDCIDEIIKNIQIFSGFDFVDTGWYINVNDVTCTKYNGKNKIYLKINNDIKCSCIEKIDNNIYVSININNAIIKYELSLILALYFLKEIGLYQNIELIDNFIFFDKNTLYLQSKYIINFFNKIIAISDSEIQSVLIDKKYESTYCIYAIIFINMFSPACISENDIDYMYKVAVEYNRLNNNIIDIDENDIDCKYEVYQFFYNEMTDRIFRYFDKIKKRVFLETNKIYV